MSVDDVDTGVVSTFNVPEADPGVYQVVARGRGLVFLSYPNFVTHTDGQVYALRNLPPEGKGPTYLGSATLIVASQTPGQVWLQSTDLTTREVGLSGLPTTGPRKAPGVLLAAVAGGLLLEGTSLSVWNPLTGTSYPIAPAEHPIFVAATGSTVVWRSGACDENGCLHLTDISRGTDRAISLPGVVGYEGDHSTIAPDGAHLIVGLLNRASSGYATAVAVDIASGLFTIISKPASGGPEAAVWSGNGQWAFFRSNHSLFAYHVSNGQVSQLPSFDPVGAVDSR